MPDPNKNESEKDFIKRCIPILVDEGKEQNQAVAICFSLYKKSKNIKENKSFKYFLEFVKK